MARHNNSVLIESVVQLTLNGFFPKEDNMINLRSKLKVGAYGSN